jgi:hypothetical protein
MACSCSKKAMRNTMSPRSGPARPVVGPQSLNIRPALTPAAMRSMAQKYTAARTQPGRNDGGTSKKLLRKLDGTQSEKNSASNYLPISNSRN